MHVSYNYTTNNKNLSRLERFKYSSRSQVCIKSKFKLIYLKELNLRINKILKKKKKKNCLYQLILLLYSSVLLMILLGMLKALVCTLNSSNVEILINFLLTDFWQSAINNSFYRNLEKYAM